MPTASGLPPGLAARLAAIPTHQVLRDITEAAREAKLLRTKPFKKVVSYLLEQADGRDRREPFGTRPGESRPVPKLRLALEECFGVYADLHWFRLNRAANRSGKPLTGLFPRLAATLWRIAPEDMGDVVTALTSEMPDAALLRFLQKHGGKVRGVGVETFSRLAYAYRRDLYFVIPKEWGETSGCLEFLGNDLRKYCTLCRNMRTVCDDLGYDPEVRASIVDNALSSKKPPPDLLEALHRAIGPSLAQYSGIDAGAAFEVAADGEDPAAMPLEFAFGAVRSRRGPRALRDALLRASGDRCALTGGCLRELLEVAVVMPYPTEQGPTAETAMLLRSDVHTLWDLNLIGIEASSNRVFVADRLRGSVYEKLAGRTLLRRKDGSCLDVEALRERWRMFVAAHPQSTTAPRDAPSSSPAPSPASRVPDTPGEHDEPVSRGGRLESDGSAAGLRLEPDPGPSRREILNDSQVPD